MLVKITMVNIPSLIAKVCSVCSAETPNNRTITCRTGRDACGLQRPRERHVAATRLTVLVFRRDAGNCTRGRVHSPDPAANGLR